MKQIILLGLLILSFSAQADTDYTQGVFFVNEDWYGHQNSTVNYLLPDEPNGEYWTYRVIQRENTGMELGCTNQFGAIWKDRFYFIAKQDKDPGASVAGGRITVADAKTMKILYQTSLIDPSGQQCDGRGFLGIDENKGYISSSNGVWIFDLDTYEVKGKIYGTDNPNAGDGKPNTDSSGALYFGQCGSMVMSLGKVFIAHQQNGIIVVNPNIDTVDKTIGMDVVADGAGVGSLVVAKDGSVWASVTRDVKGSGSALPYLLRVDPKTLTTEVVPLPEGTAAPSNSWYAWTPDTFCASSITNTLYWSGGSNSWFSGRQVFKFDVDTYKSTKIIDLDADGENWRIYGCSMRLHPVTDELYVSLYHEFSKPVYVTRRYRNDGYKIKEYSMIENYWFPSIPVFPQANGNDASGLPDDILLDKSDRVGVIYNLHGRVVKSNVEFGNWSGLDAGIYIWRNSSKSHKFIL